MTRREVVFWYGAVSPYMAERFRALDRLNGVSFECWFSRLRSPGRSWILGKRDLDFPHRFVPTVPLPSGNVMGLPVAAWASSRPRVLITFHADPAVVLGALQAGLPRAKLAYYVEFTFDHVVRRSRAKDVLKRRLFANADVLLSPGPDADGYLTRFGVPSAKVRRLGHVIDVDRLSRAVADRDADPGRRRRLDAGLDGFVFVYVGSLTKAKGIDVLLDAFSILVGHRPDVSLLLVGDSDPRELLGRLDARVRDRVHTSPFVQAADLPDRLAMGDAFVFPTRADTYGLVIDEAMASGLPVISSDAVGELADRVEPGVTGAIIPAGDVPALARAMESYAADPVEVRRLGANARARMEGHTPEAWARAVSRIVEDLLR